MRIALGMIAVVAVAGCDLPAPEDTKAEATKRGFLTAPSQGAPDAEASDASLKVTPLREVLLAGGDVVLQGPNGYCVDPETVESRPGRSFAIMASCHILSGGDEGAPQRPALMTVTLGPAKLRPTRPNAQALADGADVPLVTGFEEDGITLALLAAGGDTVFEGGAERYWRAAFTVKERTMGVALYAPEGSPLIRDDGARLLIALRQQVIARNQPDAPQSEPEQEPEPEPAPGQLAQADTADQADGQTATAGPNIFQRLFKRNEVQ